MEPLAVVAATTCELDALDAHRDIRSERVVLARAAPDVVVGDARAAEGQGLQWMVALHENDISGNLGVFFLPFLTFLPFLLTTYRASKSWSRPVLASDTWTDSSQGSLASHGGQSTVT
ncbi:hypothetical protein DFH09DRAFT_1315555 [Mycena vulgaris]|nr:hypothetical protein DFH09DRAFT_1315555 [Mycena vulgaris]